MHLILTGATGLAGAACLHQMATTKSITKISVLSRRAVPLAETFPHVKAIIHSDFLQYTPELLEQLKGAEGCVWALAPPLRGLPLDEFAKSTKEFPLAAAKSFVGLSDVFKFVYITGYFTPQYARVKAEAEKELEKLSKENAGLRVYFPRPGYIDPRGYNEIQEFIPARTAFGKRFMDFTAPAITTFNKNLGIKVKDLAKVCVSLASGDGEKLQGLGIEEDGTVINVEGLARLTEELK